MTPISKRCRRPRERGVTLIIALIMLTALGLLAAFAVKSGTVNLRIVNNTQARQEAFTAVQAAVERTISSRAFVQQAALVAATPIPVDVDGDGVADLTATLTPAPTCYRWTPVKMQDLDPNVAADLNCMASTRANSVGDSLCADAEWNVRAVVSDPASGSRVAVNQGVAQRSLSTDASTICP